MFNFNSQKNETVDQKIIRRQFIYHNQLLGKVFVAVFDWIQEPESTRIRLVSIEELLFSPDLMSSYPEAIVVLPGSTELRFHQSLLEPPSPGFEDVQACMSIFGTTLVATIDRSDLVQIPDRSVLAETGCILKYFDIFGELDSNPKNQTFFGVCEPECLRFFIFDGTQLSFCGIEYIVDFKEDILRIVKDYQRWRENLKVIYLTGDYLSVARIFEFLPLEEPDLEFYSLAMMPEPCRQVFITSQGNHTCQTTAPDLLWLECSKLRYLVGLNWVSLLGAVFCIEFAHGADFSGFIPADTSRSIYSNTLPAPPELIGPTGLASSASRSVTSFQKLKNLRYLDFKSFLFGSCCSILLCIVGLGWHFLYIKNEILILEEKKKLLLQPALLTTETIPELQNQEKMAAILRHQIETYNKLQSTNNLAQTCELLVSTLPEGFYISELTATQSFIQFYLQSPTQDGALLFCSQLEKNPQLHKKKCEAVLNQPGRFLIEVSYDITQESN